MIVNQVINKVLQESKIDLIQKNALSKEYFIGYEAEYDYLVEHYQKYGNVPDLATFLSKFKDFDIVEVRESDRYLLETLYEEHLYYKTVGVIQTTADLLKNDSNEAVQFLLNQLNDLKIKTLDEGVDIINQAKQRLEVYEEKLAGNHPWYITTGFEELDDVVHGWAKGEEFVVLFARTGQGKSWVLAKTLTHAWQLGNRVGYISPEMSPTKIGYRFDTLLKNFSNKNLVWGKPEDGYKDYIDGLKKNPIPFIVATPLDFQKRITVSKLRRFIETNKLDILGIDGITYMSDERSKHGDNKTITLTNISEDLSNLSLELGIPIIVVVQSNRGGVKEEAEGTPDLENIRDSDGIAQNATKVIALRQTGAGLEFGIKKHRDGIVGGKLLYYWDIDHGVFNYIPSDEDASGSAHREKAIGAIKNSFTDGSEAF